MLAAKAWVLEQLGSLAAAGAFRYCIESTGTYHLPVILAWRGEPSIVNPLLAGPTRRKTDVLDGRLLAQHSLTGLWKASFVPSLETQILRVLWNQRNDYQRTASRIGNRINNIILRFGHTFGQEFAMRSTAAESVINDLCDGKTPRIATANPDGLPEPVRPVIRALHDAMMEAVRATRACVKSAQQFVGEQAWPVRDGTVNGDVLLELLQTVPGVGSGTALAWLAEVGDPRRFKAAKQVAAFCGCDPSLKVSAGKVTSHVRRAGNMRLHRALLYAAGSVLQRNEGRLGQWGRSIAGRHKTGGYRKAVGAIARRIACALWYVHLLAAKYDESKYTFGGRVIVEDAPASAVVPKRYVPLLHAADIYRSQQLADAFTAGRLASIRGFGESALETVKTWIEQERERDRKRKKEYVLKEAGATSKERRKWSHGKAAVRKGSRRRALPRKTTVVA